jgi:hypothetical protein
LVAHRERIVGRLKSSSNDCSRRRKKEEPKTTYNAYYQHVTFSHLYVYHPPITAKTTDTATALVESSSSASGGHYTLINGDYNQVLDYHISSRVMATLQPSPRGRVRSASSAGQSGPFEAHRVAFAGHLLELHRLVGGYYEANARDPIGSTPLHHAAQVSCLTHAHAHTGLTKRGWCRAEMPDAWRICCARAPR